MKPRYLLLDFENVQPKSLPALVGADIRVMVFLGTNQNKVPVELAVSLQSLGTQAEYVQVSGSGRNALDFHIAFALGRLVKEVPEGTFFVISKDTGFDPLLDHLRADGVDAHRFAAIDEAPLLGPAAVMSASERLAAVVDNLRSRGNARPRKRQKLFGTIHAHFQKALSQTEVDALIDALVREGHIALIGDSVVYSLPAD
jgi:hypothetical protein